MQDLLSEKRYPKDVLHDAVAHYTGGFAPGDTVYALKANPGFAPCSLCGGEGNVQATIAGKEHQVICPLCCNGNIIERHFDIFEEKVVEVELRLHIDQDSVWTWTAAPIQLTNFPYPLPPDLICRTRHEAEMKKESLEKEES